MPDDVSSRILAAATLAERHAQLLADHSATYGDLYEKLVLPSGPSHWGAVAELLRTTVQQHQPEMYTKYNVPCFDEFDSPTVVYRRCAGCHTRFFPESVQSEANGCPSVAALLPLADQIIRDLGDGK